MAEVIRYVDTDASGTGTGLDWTNAYTSLNAWESAEQTNLVDDGDWHHVYCRASSGSTDNTATTITGWTTAAANYILVEAADGDQALKSGWSTSRYRLEVTDVVPLTISENYVRIKGIQGKKIYNSSNYLALSNSTSIISGGSDIRYINCRFEGDGNGFTEGIRISDADATVSIINTIVTNSNRWAVNLAAGATVNIYNSIFTNVTYSSGDGISIHSAATVKVINCAVFNNSNDFEDNSGTATIDHCASDDGDGTNVVSPSGSDWDNEYTDPANGDFTLKNTGNCYHGGASAPDSSLYTTDMEGDSYYSTAYSIGVDEIVSAVTLITPQIQAFLRRIRS